MAGVSDKARFYLERAAPELREWEEKGIFSKDEIRSLVAKRSSFEHQILAPRTKPADFLAYVAWETSLGRLRAARCRRLAIRSSSSSSPSWPSSGGSRASHARTFGILERAVLKHPGSVALWRAYLDFAAAARASKRWRRVAARALRLHPTDAALWALAGWRAAEAGDMPRARAHFLRGCRFCTAEPTLWVEYARCEMVWLAKVDAKRAGLGGGGGRKAAGVNALEAIKAAEATDEWGVIRFDEEGEEDDDGEGRDEEGLMLPDPDAVGSSGKAAKPEVFDEEATRKLEQSPALSGAIPMAIFDVARKQPFFGPVAAEAFFDAFAGFTDVSSHGRIVQHVLGAMEELFPDDPCTCSCQVRQPVIWVDVRAATFPKALRESLARLKAALGRTTDRKALAGKMLVWIDAVLAADHLDAAIRTVLEHTKRSLAESLS